MIDLITTLASESNEGGDDTVLLALLGFFIGFILMGGFGR